MNARQYYKLHSSVVLESECTTVVVKALTTKLPPRTRARTLGAKSAAWPKIGTILEANAAATYGKESNDIKE